MPFWKAGLSIASCESPAANNAFAAPVLMTLFASFAAARAAPCFIALVAEDMKVDSVPGFIGFFSLIFG
jgi:hypothetical protein